MSDNQQAFYERATEMIKLANQQNQNTEIQTDRKSVV